MWEVLKSIGFFTVAAGALTWLIRALVTHFLDKDVSKYKQQLASAHDAEIEKLRSDFRVRQIEHEIRFRSIHEKQAEVFAETYAALYELYKAVSSYTRVIEWESEPDKSEKLKLVNTAYEKFRACFYPRRLYFPRATGDRVRDIGDRFAKVANLYTLGLRLENAGHERTAASEDRETHIERLMEDTPAILTQLEEDFQKLLGVISNPSEQNG